jgi:hypothetical protein
VRARIDRERGSFQAFGDWLAVHGHFDGDQVAAGGVLRGEDDGRDGGIDLGDAAGALVANVGRAARRGADQALGAGLAQLVLVAQRQRALAGGQAVGGRRVGGAGGAPDERRAGERQQGDEYARRQVHVILVVAVQKHSRLKCLSPWASR